VDRLGPRKRSVENHCVPRPHSVVRRARPCPELDARADDADCPLEVAPADPGTGRRRLG
jgi:hypothetical protein